MVLKKERILSVFIDESGDFGKFSPKYPMYYVAMVFHDQSLDISKNLGDIERHIANWGYPNHAIHTGPLIRREHPYKEDLRENRKSLFNALYHFARMLDFRYICPRINQAECEEKTSRDYTDKLSKAIAAEIRRNYDYINSFDKIIVYYDHGQDELTKIITSVFNSFFVGVEYRVIQPLDYRLAQVADLICTLEMLNDKVTFTQSEVDFFHSKNAFKKNIYKNIAKKKL